MSARKNVLGSVHITVMMCAAFDSRLETNEYKQADDEIIMLPLADHTSYL